MSDDPGLAISKGPTETILDGPPDAWADALAGALSETATSGPADRKAELSRVAGTYPAFVEVWAALAEVTPEPVEAYAYARAGYHRGLDLLRQSGWRGTGYLRWAHPTNRGFLRALEALRRCAGAIGEVGEEQRCALFLHQLDPSWPPPDRHVTA